MDLGRRARGNNLVDESTGRFFQAEGTGDVLGDRQLRNHLAIFLERGELVNGRIVDAGLDALRFHCFHERGAIRPRGQKRGKQVRG
ncbi:MAG: hypothetical protein HGA94_00605 [Candidatus Aminicenantes bacterium]|nr:hypothetical protein [Candidatus Aminicenantes bacterium]